jgi:hypothetical protein
VHQTLHDLHEAGVTVHPMTAVRAWRDGEAVLQEVVSGRERTLDRIDGVVLVTGWEADDALGRELEARGVRARHVGDCVAPRRLQFAVFDGYMAGIEI